MAVRKLAAGQDARRRSCASWGRPAWARPAWAARSPRRWGASSCASRWAASATRPRSAATGAPISARCRAAIIQTMRRPARSTRSSCWTRSTSWAPTSGAIRRRRCWRCWTPSRTHAFSRHYLDVPTTCRRCCSSRRPTCSTRCRPALRDRMEVIELPGYIEDEKFHIAQQLPGAAAGRRSTACTPPQLRFTDEALRSIIREYTREAGRAQPGARDRHDLPQGGARGGEGCRRSKAPTPPMARRHRKRAPDDRPVCRATSRACAATSAARWSSSWDRASVAEERATRSGVATGVAWTPVGGDMMGVEVTLMEGKGKLMLTGQLGDVMKESAQAALSYARVARHAAAASTPSASRSTTSTSMCRRARCRRRAHRRASRWPRR